MISKLISGCDCADMWTRSVVQTFALSIRNRAGNYLLRRRLTCNFDHWILPMHLAEFLHAVFAPNINSESFNWYPPVICISLSICVHRAWYAGDLNLFGCKILWRWMRKIRQVCQIKSIGVLDTSEIETQKSSDLNNKQPPFDVVNKLLKYV